MAKAVVVGSDGQDGSYLTRFLQEKNYEVVAVGRASLDISSLDICDPREVQEYIRTVAPQEIYHLAAFHHSTEDAVMDDLELVAQSLAVNTLSLNNFLSAIARHAPSCRLFYASSSRVFGRPPAAIQNELTPLDPRCPYGISKAAGMHLCRYYRDERRVFCSTGILYNHESPLRSPKFVSRKVVQAAVAVKRGSQNKLVVGSLDAPVDWGYAPDYVEAMWRILQLEEAQDFVIASGTLHTVRDFVAAAFDAVGLRWQDHVQEDPSLLRGTSPEHPLCGDSSKLRRLTGWAPQTSFQETVQKMLTAELEGSGS